jgi:hypothetical protein
MLEQAHDEKVYTDISASWSLISLSIVIVSQSITGIESVIKIGFNRDVLPDRAYGNDILVINGLVNIINKPTHFDARSGNTSLLDPILITVVTSLEGMHVFAILRNVLVKFEHAELISTSASITFSQSVSVILTAKNKFKTQRNKFNNLKKQAKQRFYDNINEHLDDLKTVNSQMYWKTIHMLLKNDRSTNELSPLHDLAFTRFTT